MNIEELSALSELSTDLTTADIKQIQIVIAMPEGMCEDTKHGINFLNAMRGWKQLNPYLFYLALGDIRPDLIAVACRIPWLCVSDPSEYEAQEKELSIKTLVELLKSELTTTQWLMIYIAVTNESGINVGFEVTLTKMLEKGLINKNLVNLQAILKGIQREDMVCKLREYQRVFVRMEDGEFEAKFRNELGTQAKELEHWKKNLKEFSLLQYGTIQQMIGEDELVSLKQVYIELTILRQKPRAINLEDETTYNEIAYLRKIANKEVTIIPIDFTEELITYEPTIPEIWCLIGNPGCGKTFLAKRTALRFSSNELIDIHYTIFIPCRNTDWHSMESTRYEEENKVNSEFIQQWLCLGLPVGPSWTIDLAKHLNESSGEGLLLIIDGLDEFTRKVPFGKTFLCLLLTRQSLIKSTIILTSRPGAWTDISSNHELKINRYYQVLGFSPENRDLYFKKQIANETKLNACLDLMERHDEMKQLSLIPVNASLFAALLRGEDSASINTLTKLYCELTLYLIRREVSRMGLQEFSRVARLSDFHPDIQACLKRIGFIAFLGVANRDLMSEENVPLFMGLEEYPSHCLGLAHEHYKKEAVGLIKKVWTFVHLTMQEFTAAHWLSNNTWTEQCLSIRYISHSTANFSLFKMLVRFLCGILSDKSASILYIMYRYLTPQPTHMIHIPMTYQLMRDVTKSLIMHTGLEDFAKSYFELTSMLFETNSCHIITWFGHFSKFLPFPFSLYIKEPVTHNEWFCFLKSLQFISQIELINIRTEIISPIQFECLLKEMKICSVNSLAIIFNFIHYTTVLEYTKIIRYAEFSFDTKISIDLFKCNMTDTTAVELFSPTTNQKLSCINLRDTMLSNAFLNALANQLTALDCIVLPDKYDQEDYLQHSLPPINYENLFPNLCQATQLRVLHLNGFPEEYDSYLREMLLNFSNLQEIQLDNYSQSTPFPVISSLTYLHIGDEKKEMEETDSSTLYADTGTSLLQLITNNIHALRVVKLYYLNCSDIRCWSTFLNALSLCTKIVQLELTRKSIPADDNNLWNILGENLKSLIIIHFYKVTLYDKGYESLCAGLAFHPTIRKLRVTYANLTSLSCDPLIHLIPTVTQLEELNISGLKKGDKKKCLLLQQTTDVYSIKLEWK